jgi:3-isopropylmalate dehydrogenase
MRKTIAVLPGDGIGPEIMKEAIKVLRKIAVIFDHEFIFHEAFIGGAAWERYGEHFPAETKGICEGADAILFGSVGGPVQKQTQAKWKDCERNSILHLRQHFHFQTNLRPLKVFLGMINACVLRPEIIKEGIDILCVRELSGDIYFGEHQMETVEGIRKARDIMAYDEHTIADIAHVAFQAARQRRRKVTSVDKANVLACSRLWREVVNEVSRNYRDCELEHMLVDNCAMQVIRNPTSFDVLLMPNMFGDILSDEVSVLAGSLGMLPSASLNKHGFGLYEPSSGSAPDIAGKGIANPIGQILSAAMLLEHSFEMVQESRAIQRAVEKSIEAGYRTADIAMPRDRPQPISTEEMGTIITNYIIR